MANYYGVEKFINGVKLLFFTQFMVIDNNGVLNL